MESKIKTLMSDWNYDEAVKIATPIAREWKKRTVDMARILYIANRNLSRSGYRRDLESNVYLPTSGNIAEGCKENLTISEEDNSAIHKTWEDFCIDIGLPLRTARDWLACYDPDKDLLLSRQEYKEAKQLELDTLYGNVEKMRETDADYVPESLNLKWSRNQTRWSETKYQKWLMEKNFDRREDVVKKAGQMVVDRDARITEFGLWNTDYIYSLAVRCSKLTHEDPEHFTALVREYEPLLPKAMPARDFMRLLVIVEATMSDLGDRDRTVCMAHLARLIECDRWRRDADGSERRQKNG